MVLVSLLAMGWVDRRFFHRRIDWPMIFFLMGLNGFTDAIGYLGLDQAMLATLAPALGWLGGSLSSFILLVLAVTVILRLALPATAGMVLAATLLLPVGVAQGIHPWIVVFLASLFSDIWFFRYQNAPLLLFERLGTGSDRAKRLFYRYSWGLNGARVVLAFASIPYWRWLGLSA